MNHIVLISTYWNVNFEIIAGSASSTGFNLNLLECKYKFEAYNNIPTIVLISTYWNVNSFVMIPKFGTTCFNLNLLECKCSLL